MQFAILTYWWPESQLSSGPPGGCFEQRCRLRDRTKQRVRWTEPGSSCGAGCIIMVIIIIAILAMISFMIINNVSIITVITLFLIVNILITCIFMIVLILLFLLLLDHF